MVAATTYRGLGVKEWYQLARSPRTSADWRCKAYKALYSLGAKDRLEAAFDAEKDEWAMFCAACYVLRLSPGYAPARYFMERFLKEHGRVDLQEWEKMVEEGRTPLQLKEKERVFFAEYPFRSPQNEAEIFKTEN